MSEVLRQALLGVLNQLAAYEMNFVAGPIYVRGAGLQMVRGFLHAKKIGVRVGPVPPGANAIYHKGSNEFVFKSSSYGSTPDQQSSMLHECCMR